MPILPGVGSHAGEGRLRVPPDRGQLSEGGAIRRPTTRSAVRFFYRIAPRGGCWGRGRELLRPHARPVPAGDAGHHGVRTISVYVAGYMYSRAPLYWT